MQHSFDVDLAVEYGVTEAILLNHLYFWIEKNRANERHYHDGLYWTYNSVRAFNEIFPYLSTKKINNALKHLEREGLLVKGNYNETKYDRTLWYALTNMGISICQKDNFHLPKRENGNSQKGKPIPDINTYIKPDVYSKPQKTATEKASKQFHNFSQRDYNFEELEKKMLS